MEKKEKLREEAFQLLKKYTEEELAELEEFHKPKNLIKRL